MPIENAGEHHKSEQLHSSETRLERDGDVVHLYKPEGTYTVIYNKHDVAVDPRLLPVDLNGAMLELTSDYITNPVETIKNLEYPEQFGNYPLYRRIIPFLAERRIPIYFTDVAVNDSYLYSDSFLEALESVFE